MMMMMMICFNHKASEEKDLLMPPRSTVVTSNRNRIQWHAVIQSLGLAEGYRIHNAALYHSARPDLQNRIHQS